MKRDELSTVAGARADIVISTVSADFPEPDESAPLLEQAAASFVRNTNVAIAPRVVLRSVIETLSSKQRAHLRSLAHELKPVLHIGKDGLTGATVAAAKEAFNTRELVKIRVLENAPNETRDAAQQLANEMEGSSVVQIIGRTAVLYRPDPDRPRIVLPQ